MVRPRHNKAKEIGRSRLFDVAPVATLCFKAGSKQGLDGPCDPDSASQSMKAPFPATRLVGTDERHAPRALLKAIGEKATAGQDGRPTWNTFQIERLFECVTASVAIKQPDGQILNEHDTDQIVSASIQAVLSENGCGRAVAAEKLINVIEARAKRFFGEAEQERLFVTSISMQRFSAQPLNILGTSVSVSDRAEFPFPAELSNQAGFARAHVRKSKYLTIGVKTKCITESQAIERGNKVVFLLLGVLNHILTRGSSSVSFMRVPTREAIGQVFASPIATLHNSSDPCDLYSYDPDYFGEQPLFDRPVALVEELFSAVMSRIDVIESSSLKFDLIDIFCRYARAVALPNHGIAFLLLWSILEKVTNTIGKDYDKTIARTIWPLSDRTIPEGFMRLLRLKRNLYVHSGTASDNQLRFCYLLKKYVDIHLGLLLLGTFEIATLEEYGQILDMPRDEKRLALLARRNQAVAAFHNPEAKPTDLSD